MKTNLVIVITPPNHFKGETGNWMKLIDNGLETLHVRKPGLTQDEIKKMLHDVPVPYRKKMVVHHHAAVQAEMGLKGFHVPPDELLSIPLEQGREYTVSCPVHHWPEVEGINSRVDYCLVSPVFNSISKEGHKANKALGKIPVNHWKTKLYALGGINETNVIEAFGIGYHGVALLGSIWNTGNSPVAQYKKIVSAIKNNQP